MTNVREQLKKEYRGITIDGAEKEEYLERLRKQPKTGEYSFYDQYKNGEGDELGIKKGSKGKFFSIISSSRFAFELFSWMAEDSRFINFSVEKKLPKLQYSPTCPNIDIYYETNDKITFIESKFTETTYNKKGEIPEAYYKEKGDTWDTGARDAKHKRLLKSSLEQRYRKNKDIEKALSVFISDVEKALPSKAEGPDWFDVKQECCHLVGIALYCYEKELKHEKVKDVEFINVVHDFEGDCNSKIHDYFVPSANKMMKELLTLYGVNSFEYKTMHHTEYLEYINFDIATKAYGIDDTVINRLKQFDMECGII